LKNKEDGPISSKVKDRFGEIFDEHEKDDAMTVNGNNFEDAPITGLKTTLLSIDWEISDEVLRTLIEEIGRLETVYKHDKDILLFLQLLNSVGKYIKKRKVNAHPDAIKLLNSVYDSLEQVLLSKNISSEEKRQKLLDQVEAFKKLKEQIALKKTGVAINKKEVPSEKPMEEVLSDTGNMNPQETLALVLAEITQVIRAEFKALRKELKK
jgi:pilus assembly protein FimV